MSRTVHVLLCAEGYGCNDVSAIGVYLTGAAADAAKSTHEDPQNCYAEEVPLHTGALPEEPARLASLRGFAFRMAAHILPEDPCRMTWGDLSAILAYADALRALALPPVPLPEVGLSDAPVEMDSREACAWAEGFNSARERMGHE
jgi:hypothetical protein